MSPFRHHHHPPTAAASLLLPLALTLTSAAVAAAGLYLWPGSNGGHPGDTDSDTDGGGGGLGGGSSSGLRRKPSRTKRVRKYERITEEDTDGLEEERRKGGGKGKGREKEGGGGEGAGMMMAGALVGESIGGGGGQGISATSGRMEEKKAVEVVGGSGSVGGGGAVMGGKQFVPPPPRKKSVAIVVSERKMLSGQERDMDPEEAGLPSSLLSHLPHPLDLTHTTVNILIYSPLLKAHPLSHQSAFRGVQAAAEPIGATRSRPPRKPSAPHFSPSASTFTLAASMLPSSCPLEHILPFTQPASIVPLLRALAPDTVYIEEPLTLPSSGGIVAMLLEGGWVGNIVVGLIGDDNQLAQLMDSDDEKAQEDEKTRKGEGKWWGTETFGSIRGAFGSRVQIVEGWVLVEDWRRRVVERS